MQAVENQTYNGWKNYPTWAVNLWLNNDEGLYNYCRELVDSVEGEENKRFKLAGSIERFVDEDLAPDLGASFAADLLGWSLSQVDWFEIADAFLED